MYVMFITKEELANVSESTEFRFKKTLNVNIQFSHYVDQVFRLQLPASFSSDLAYHILRFES